tara:strand:+ start:3621 stop:4670 length:1050 start_codon:yes stop_codon:yes gene_type:complete
MSETIFVGVGIRRRRDQKTLDVYFPEIKEIQATDTLLASTNTIIERQSLTDEQELSIQGNLNSFLLEQRINENIASYSKTDIVVSIFQDVSKAIQSTEEAYFKLQLLSQRLKTPHSLNLEGLFGILHNIAWTNKGPILAEDCDRERMLAYVNGETLLVTHVDKFPYLVNYHIPKGTRIAAGSQVRLGAYLGEGTTIMPAGYVNFNAGTMGKAMIEGRVSAGVVVGDDSDIGGGASIMGTLSGGNNAVIEIGESCLLGANAGTGISLGKGSTIAAGLYIYAGMKVSLVDHENNPVDIHGNSVSEGANIVKASELSGLENKLFIKDSQTGKVICKPNNNQITLNTALHTND